MIKIGDKRLLRNKSYLMRHIVMAKDDLLMFLVWFLFIFLRLQKIQLYKVLFIKLHFYQKLKLFMTFYIILRILIIQTQFTLCQQLMRITYLDNLSFQPIVKNLLGWPELSKNLIFIYNGKLLTKKIRRKYSFKDYLTNFGELRVLIELIFSQWKNE